MTRPARNLFLLAVVLALGGGLAGAALWLSQSEPPAALDLEPGRRPVQAPVAEKTSRAELVAEPTRESEDAGPTTVVYPLELELELVEARPVIELPKDVLPRGSAATARLRGNVWDAQNEGVRAQVRFEHGANEGRVLQCDSSGAFGANDLLPGLSVVAIEHPSIPGAQREVLLRQERETRIDFGFGRLASVVGEVVDGAGEPIAGARISLDGQEGTTDEAGVFRFPRVSGGQVLVTVEHPGFRSQRDVLNVTAGMNLELGKVRYVLRPGATLEVHVVERTGGEGEALLYLTPLAGETRDFPWHLVNPVRIWPGGSARVEGLPAGRIDLRLFHAGARAEPALAAVNLAPGHTTSTELHLAPAPMLLGTVKQAGTPVARARVTLEPADAVGATLSELGMSYGFVESEVLPELPPARQVAWTDAKGRFAFTAYAGLGTRYLSAVGPDKKSAALRLVGPKEEDVELALVPVDELEKLASLRLVLPGRWQALPVRVRVDGAPRDPEPLAAGRDLVIDGLVPGRWTLSARWDVDVLEKAREIVIEVDDELEIEIALPEGAIAGQSPEVRKRAGPR